MKVYVVVLILGFIALSQQDDNHDQLVQKIKANREACIKETNANAEDVRKSFQEGQFANDKNLKCFYKCMFQKAGVMNDAGATDFDIMKSHIPETADKAKAIAVIDKCKGTKGADACETAFAVAKCWRESYGPMKPT